MTFTSPFTRISGGERQLVLIARTLAQNPDIILMDEPTSHLDFKNQAIIMRSIKKLSQSGISIIMTTHAPNQAMLYADQVALMSQGRFLALGAPKDVITEDKLKMTYGIDVDILSAESKKNDRAIKYCLVSDI